MLRVTIPATVFFDEATNEFIDVKATSLQLEHSLVSISKWESKWKKPFISKTQKTRSETLDYIRCMTTSQNIDPNVYHAVTDSIVDEITAYIEDPMTATWITKKKTPRGRPEVITSELIYYWMIALNIPWECQKWHLNRLIMLIEVCNVKNEPPKKTSKRELLTRNRALNDARKRSLNTTG